MSQFTFLEAEFSEQFELVQRAERYALEDPGACGLYARKALESMVKWVFHHDPGMPLPFEDKLNEYLHVPKFRDMHNGAIYDKARVIQRIGNRAAHDAKPPTKTDAITVMQALYLVSHWLVFTYGRNTKPPERTPFNPQQLPSPGATERRTLNERKELEAQIQAEAEQAAQARQQAAELAKTNAELEAELAAMRAQVAEAKAASERRPLDDESLDETQTRTYLIDLYLNEAGWPLTDARDREYPVTMPEGSKTQHGYVDYVLWGDDGLPLAVVEAKRTTRSAQDGQQQAALYADALETQFGRRPIVFYTNGYEHYLWDDHADGYPSRRVYGFYTAEELERLIGQRTSRRPLSTIELNRNIAGRPYQERAIRSMTEAFENKVRKGLLVMATGSGKTRTVIALTDVLQQANWVKRVLFLADRQELVSQAAGAYTAHLPDIDPVNLLTEPNKDGRVYVSTYQTMVGKIDERRPDGTQRFGVGHFDLVVIDEAHRSVYRKYKGIFEHFDSLLVGLTATPREEIDRDTYGLFDLQQGFPTDAYPLDEAIDDGYLVPPKGVSVPLKFVRQGIRYDDLSEEEKLSLEESGWGDDDGDGLIDDGSDIPPDVSPDEINKWLFNTDTVDKALEHLMTHGIRVAGGDRLGKTIVFAKNQDHAQFIKDRFDLQYPSLDAGRFAQVITHSGYDPKAAITNFKKKESSPHIAISVDMLDTGIDVPEVVNLVIFKPVRSKTKFWQMIGRGTRLCPDLYAPGDDKTHFLVFDYCGNLEYFGENPDAPEGTMGASLSERLFAGRVELLDALAREHGGSADRLGGGADDSADSNKDVTELAAMLRETVASMNRGNFLVRKHLRLVEKYSESTAWADTASVAADKADLMRDLAPLPDQMPAEQEDSKRFDLMVMHCQLGVLNHEPWEAARRRIVAIAGLLEGKASIPAIAKEMELITAIQSEDWWIDTNYRELELMRRKIRGLVPLIEKKQRKIVTTDLEDELGDVTDIDFAPVSDFAYFRQRAEAWLSDNMGDEVIAKVRSGEPLTVDDEADLQRLLVAGGVGDHDSFAAASERAGSLALFVRTLIGLDRPACQARFAEFLDDKNYNANQIRFVKTLIDELAGEGVVKAERLYEQPYMGFAPEGPEQLFTTEDVDRIFAAINELNSPS